jgi:hypothetical protein
VFHFGYSLVLLQGSALSSLIVSLREGVGRVRFRFISGDSSVLLLLSLLLVTSPYFVLRSSSEYLARCILHLACTASHSPYSPLTHYGFLLSSVTYIIVVLEHIRTFYLAYGSRAITGGLAILNEGRSNWDLFRGELVKLTRIILPC